MIVDAYSGQHSAVAPAALTHYAAAVTAVAAHRAAAGEHLAAALAEAPDFLAAHVLKGFAAVILARRETMTAARDALGAARIIAAEAVRAPGELAMLESLTFAVDGELRAAARRLDVHLLDNPRDFLAIKLSHAMNFMAGNLHGMLKTTGMVLNDWSPRVPGYGFVLGCHAFGLEEAGDLDAAETLGMAALRHEPTDAWGLHAVSHVFEMDGRTQDGVRWLEATRPVWSNCNNFAFHMGWHLALFHVAQGRHDLALAVYDAEIRPVSTEDFRDVVNAVSLLWRLRQESVAVGARWEELHGVARRRTADTTLLFTSLHHLLTMIAVGDRAGARAVAHEIAARAAQGGDQGRVGAAIGTELAAALLGLADASAPAPDFMRLAEGVTQLGGSHAQRDVFLRTLALIAADRADRRAANAVLQCRRAFRHDDRFVGLALGRLNFALKAREERAVA